MILYSEEYWNDVEKIIPYIINKESLYGKSVFITGAGGLICSTVCDVIFYLNKNYNANITLFIAGRNKEKLSKRFYCFQEGSEWYFVQYDATKEFCCDKKIDFIIHGASYGDPSGIMKEPVETMLCNFNGLYSLLDFLYKQSYGRLLFISSSEVYGKKASNDSYTENDYGFVDLLLPRSSYPSSKRAAETLCVSFYTEYGVNSVIARPGHIYGSQISNNDSRVSAECTRKAKNHQSIELRSSGSQLRSYTYSLDCASAILTIILNGETCKAYNISNKNSICSIKEFAEGMAKIADVLLEVNASSNSAEKKNWNAMDNSSLNANLLESLGWRGVFSLEDGVKRTFDYFKQ